MGGERHKTGGSRGIGCVIAEGFLHQGSKVINLASIDGVSLNPQETYSYAASNAGRMGTTEDMAGAAIYLASRAGDYVVSSTLVIDGGVTHALGVNSRVALEPSRHTRRLLRGTDRGAMAQLAAIPWLLR